MKEYGKVFSGSFFYHSKKIPKYLLYSMDERMQTPTNRPGKDPVLFS
jgi:hypothetical protein